jgi:hypothetical protein
MDLKELKMTKIEPELEQQLKAKPDQTVDLIVRTNGDPTPRLDWLTSTGIQVKQQFRLSPGIAVRCSGAAALKLLDQDWVRRIELDRPVTTM